MFSGKTTELMRRITRFRLAKLDCAVIKYNADTRYSVEDACTHDDRKLSAIPAERLEDVYQQVKNMDVVGIDEGQFFPDIVAFSERLANEGKIVIVAALDGTFQRKPFGTVLELVPLAESVHKLSAVCMECFNPAAFSKRIGSDQRVQVIGGAETYLAVCRRCFLSLPVTPHSPSKFKKARLNAHHHQMPPAAAAQLFH
jgi:thymidine kinase